MPEGSCPSEVELTLFPLVIFSEVSIFPTLLLSLRPTHYSLELYAKIRLYHLFPTQYLIDLALSEECAAVQDE